MSRLLPLDHLIYAATDLDEAIAAFAQRLGVCAVRGGTHEALGTHNAIVPLGPGRYVELVALDPLNPSPPLPPPFGLASLSQPRLVTWAVRSQDIAADTRCAKRRGYDAGVTVPVSRTTPEGERLTWQLTVRPDGFGDGVIPFVIDWGDAHHPSRESQCGQDQCALQHLEAFHPRADAISGAIDALGVRLDVQLGATPHLRATLTGPAGTLELR